MFSIVNGQTSDAGQENLTFVASSNFPSICLARIKREYPLKVFELSKTLHFF